MAKHTSFETVLCYLIMFTDNEIERVFDYNVKLELSLPMKFQSELSEPNTYFNADFQLRFRNKPQCWKFTGTVSVWRIKFDVHSLKHTQRKR